MPNAKFTYLYRNGSNYKTWGSVIFANPDALSCEHVGQRLRKALMTDATFVADQIRVPELFPFAVGTADVDDHCLHEFYSIEDTKRRPTDIHHRAVVEFLREVEAAARQGWVGFLPDSPTMPRTRFRLAF